MKTMEYLSRLIVHYDLQRELTALAEAGWEIMAVLDYRQPDISRTQQYTVVARREKST